MKLELLELWSHTSKRRHKQFGLILILMIISSIAEIASIGAVIPFLGVLTSPEYIFQYPEMQPIIDFFQFKNSDELIFPIVMIFIISAMTAGVIRVALLYITTRFTYAAGADMAIDVYRRILHQDYAAHAIQNSSEIITSVTSKTNAVIGGVLYPVLVLISSLILIVFIIFTLFFVNPVSTLIAFSGFGILYWVLILFTRAHLYENSKCIAKESTQIIKTIQEGLGGIRDVIIDSNQEFYSKIYQNSDRPLRRALGNNVFINGSPRYVMESIGMILIAGMAYFMSLQEGGVVSVIPVLGALALGAQRILPALQQIYSSYTNIKSSNASFRDIMILLEQPIVVNSNLLDNKSIVFERNIHLNNINFQYYKTKKQVLKNINLTINKGETVGFIGDTGSGKSTLLDVVMGLLTPTSGEICIDDVIIDKSNQHLWQKYIAHVPQSIFLSDNTIEENIAFGVPVDKINKTRVQEAVKKSQLDGFIESLADGYQTIVGERGVRLSGGQRQRIGIARALYKQAKVLIFDEATSALDVKTEKKVMESISKLNETLTILIIAHRVSTLEDCDWIVEVSNSGCKRVEMNDIKL